MKIILILIALLPLCIGVVAGTGALLPKKHVASMSVMVNANPYRVWAVIADPSAYTTWRTNLKSATVTSKSPLAWTEESSMGPMSLEVDEFVPPSRMVASVTDKKAPFSGSWTYELAADPANAERTKVTITEEGEVPNPIFRFVSRFVMGHYGGIDTYLRQLSKKFGAEGTPAQVTPKDSSSAG